MTLTLRQPSRALLDGYVAALRAGWSPNTVQDVSAEQLAAIAADADAFLASFEERDGRTVTLPDGRVLPRLPGPVFWISDGAFCGQINLRYQPDTLELPQHVSGHVGYAVVPWKHRQGIATAALLLLLPVAKARGLPRVLITCDEDNMVSRRIIERVGGEYAGRVTYEVDGIHKRQYWVETG